ncbi:hypothetical protein ACSAZK_02540 [Methanosarcina sp. Mfa9]|uniref:hypothetical protein n=1 Tax=Methanosarcina sp. Mfa9 TaxID=3439063 RepID=UPI003F858FEA
MNYIKPAFDRHFVFSDLPDKISALIDLQRLTSDQELSVRVYANHSLGKVSISQASPAKKDEDYKGELEKTIEFFEKEERSHPLNSLIQILNRKIHRPILVQNSTLRGGRRITG